MGREAFKELQNCQQSAFRFIRPVDSFYYFILINFIFIHFGFFYFLFFYFFISWRLITLQYCSGFCHTLT